MAAEVAYSARENLLWQVSKGSSMYLHDAQSRACQEVGLTAVRVRLLVKGGNNLQPFSKVHWGP